VRGERRGKGRGGRRARLGLREATVESEDRERGRGGCRWELRE
jgi:hypothetical protein